jgi:hypothetical protein
MTDFVDTRNWNNRGSQIQRPFDKSTKIPVGLGELHGRIHDGEYFIFSDSWTNIDTDDWVGLAWSVPDDQGYTFLPHFHFNVTAGKTCLVDLYEFAVTDEDFDGEAYNARRPSSNAPEMVVQSVTSAKSIGYGNKIFAAVVGIGTPLNYSGIYGLGEIIGWQMGEAPPNGSPGGPQCYFLKITAKEDDAIIAASLGWYEHTDKE